MNRLLATSAVLGVLFGTTGLALAQGAPANPYYSPAPAYGQPMTPPPAAVAQAPAWQNVPATDPHSSGTAGRAYYGGQKSN